MNWRDLHIAMAVGTHGNLSDAAHALALDPTTVSRRVTALEGALGTPLFRRAPRQWDPTEAGVAVLAHCARMADEVRALQHEADRISGRVHGRVRLTAIDAVCTTWLVPALGDLRAAHPDLQLELLATNRVVDLTRGTADVAIRLRRPQRAGLIVRRLARLPLVVAGTPELAALPRAERPVSLLGVGDLALPENTVTREHGGPVAATATSFAVQLSLILGGLGIGALPTRMAEAHGLAVIADAPARTLWRATPETLHRSPRIQAVCEWVDGIFAA